MLSALKPEDDAGEPIDRECIYERCRFFNLDQRDCTLMMGSQAMLRMADEGSRPSPPVDDAAPPSIDLERRLDEVGRDLRQVSEEIQGRVREAGQSMADRMAAVESKQEAGEASILKRLEDVASRFPVLLRERVDETVRGLTDQMERRFTSLEQMTGQSTAPLRASIEEQGLTLAARIDEVKLGISECGQTSTQLKAQLDAMVETQQKMAERFLEEISLIGATLKKLEQSVSTIDTKLEATANEGMNLSQIVTLVKGETERTYASLRCINEGNKSVLEAIETQLQRDQEDLKRKRRDEALMLNNRGVVLYYRGALEAAVEAFRQALQMQPDYAEAFNNLGLALSKLGHGDEAADAFRQALKIDPKMGEVYNNLGFLYHTAAQFDRAVQMFGQAIDNASDSSVAYTNLGNTFYKMQQAEKAVEAWRRALELDPMNENARRGLRMFQQDAANN
jgi:Tfp pilus assembly protein PilF